MRRFLIIGFIFISLLGFSQTDSLKLSKAIAIALENNYDIVIQKKTTDVTKENNTWGNAGALPTMTLSGNGSETWSYSDETNAQASSYSSTVSLDWVVFRGFSARIQKSKLEKLQEQSEASLALLTENTIVNVTLAYYNALLQYENMHSAEEVMKLSEDRYSKEKLKKDLGSSKTYDLLQSQNSWLEDKANYLSAKTSYRNALRQLNYLMAMPLESQYQLQFDFVEDTTTFSREVLIGKMLSNNNTLKNQYINLELAKLDIKSARSAYYPTISAGANGGYSSSATDYSSSSVTDLSSNGYSTGISASVSYSLYEGGQRRTALKVAKMQEEISQVETKQMEEELKNQLAQELELYEVRKELLTLAKEKLTAAELNLKLSTQKFESGTINSFNFRDVQQIYITSTVNYYESLYNLIESYNALLQLTGGIIEDLN